MNVKQLQAITERADKATPGPWVVEESRFGNFNAASENESYDLPACLMNGADAQFVTNAREDVPALIAEVRRLRAALELILEDEAPNCDGYETLIHIIARKALEDDSE